MPSLIPEVLDAPATHVLVIGVSAYKHFDGGAEPTHNGELLGMEQLSAAARSASEFAAWMASDYANDQAPLGSLRVLLSPSPNEQIHPDIAAQLGGDFSATLENVKNELLAFRAACNTHTDNVAVVYVAGHGVQLTKNGAMVLLHDCGAANHLNVLDGAIDMASVHAGFNHPNTAQTQFWFVDACRQRPAVAGRFETMAGGLRLDEPPGVAESTAMFLAAVTGTPAFARTGGITLFNEALMWGLRGGIAVAPNSGTGDVGPGISSHWHISVHELIKRLQPRVKALAQAEGAEQTVDPAGRLNDAVLHEFATTPTVELRVELRPDAATGSCRCSLRHGQLGVVLDNINHWPLVEQVDAGIYEITIDCPAPFVPFADFINLQPPSLRRLIDVAS